MFASFPYLYNVNYFSETFKQEKQNTTTATTETKQHLKSLEWLTPIT